MVGFSLKEGNTKMSKLMLHCGGEPISYEALRELPEPEAKGPRHCPVAYHRFVDEVLGGLQFGGMKIRTQDYGLNAKGKQLFGLLTLADDHTGREVALGLRASHNKTLPMSLAIGSHVFVCDNLAFSAEFILATRSTPKVMERLPNLVIEAVKCLLPFRDVMDNEVEAWKADRLPDWSAERLMIAAVRTETVPPSYLGRWIEEYEHPSAPEHKELEGTKLGLYNAATAALRPVGAGRNLDTHIRRTLALRSMFNHPLDDIASWERPRLGGGVRELTNSGWKDRLGKITDVDVEEVIEHEPFDDTVAEIPGLEIVEAKPKRVRKAKPNANA
jgi:hypothetical protein